MSRGKCASLYTWSSVWDELVVIRGVSVDITNSSFRACSLACRACTDMVYSKELERDVTTTAMAQALLRLKSLV